MAHKRPMSSGRDFALMILGALGVIGFIGCLMLLLTFLL